MSSLLSVLVTKCPESSAIKMFKTDPKSVRTALTNYDKGCTAFIETIADLDNAHFMSMYEMQAFVSDLMGMEFKYPPRDRLVAAKALAEALSQKQKELPDVPAIIAVVSVPTRVCMPQAIITPCRKGTKLAILVDCLKKGSTMEEMKAAIGQKEGGVLSSLNWDLNHRKGIGYRVTKKDSVDFYTLVLPEGFDGTLIA